MRKLILVCSTLLCLHYAQSQHTLLIKNINIVDVEKGTLLKNAQVYIRDSIIASIGKNITTKADSIIDGNNRYLIPGLWDMHTHVWMEDPIFPLLLTNGVTGVRDMFDSIHKVHQWRQSIHEGRYKGPFIFAAGPIVDGEKPIWPASVAVSTPAQGRRAVDSLKNILHTDFIKVYTLLTRDAYFAIADESKKQQITFAGHVPNLVTVVEAAEAGQKSQEHLFGFIEAGSDSAEHYMQLLQKKISDTTLTTPMQKRQFVYRTFNKERLKGVLQKIKQTDSWICPTTTVLYSVSHYSDTALTKDPRLIYFHPFVLNSWQMQQNMRAKPLTREAYVFLHKEFELKLQIIKAIHDAGIPLLAGTDFPNPYCLPGFSIHDELQWFVKAGLTPTQALQTATVNAARFLNLQQTYGSVAMNRVADLVILEKNPLEDIKNTTTINTVVLHGKVISQQAIQQMLAKLKSDAGH